MSVTTPKASLHQRSTAKPPAIPLSQKPIYIKIANDVDFYSLFVKIEHRFDTCFLLESLGEPGLTSRYSIAGFAPERIIRARESTLIVDDQAYETPNPYQALKEMMPAQAISRNYAGGLVGYLGYDTINYFEPSLSVKVHPDFDQFMFGVYTDGLVLDNQTAELFYFYYNENRSQLVQELIADTSTVERAPLHVECLGDNSTKEAHAATVETVREHIKAGNIFQCETGFKTNFRITGDTLAIYERLRTVNPSPYMYFLKFGDKKLVGASPETLLELQDGALISRPLAGSIKRGEDAAEDKQLARQLLNDPKEIAEHNMLVDLHRNDIGRVAEFGSVRVRNLRSIKRFSHIQHIESEITGRLRGDEDMFSAVAANFPAGTLSGAPKIEAMKIIDANEPEARGPYGGAVGHFGFNGNCTFAIAIRSLFLNGERAYAQTSGGIVYDSEPDKEYDEVRRKLAAMERALEV